MRIGIDARVIYYPKRDNKTRVGHYVYSLIKGLKEIDGKNQLVLFFDSRVDHKIAKKFEDKKTRVVYFPFSRYRTFMSIGYSQLLVSAFIARERLDIFHGASGTMPLTCLTPAVLTIFQIEQGRAGRLAQGRILKKAQKIIVSSPLLKKKLVKTYKLPARKVEIIEGCDKISDTKKESRVALAKKTMALYKNVVSGLKRKKRKKKKRKRPKGKKP